MRCVGSCGLLRALLSVVLFVRLSFDKVLGGTSEEFFFTSHISRTGDTSKIQLSHTTSRQGVPTTALCCSKIEALEHPCQAQRGYPRLYRISLLRFLRTIVVRHNSYHNFWQYYSSRSRNRNPILDLFVIYKPLCALAKSKK